MFKIVHISDLHLSHQSKTASLLDFINFKSAGGLGGASFKECMAQGLTQRSHCPDVALGLSQFLSTNLRDHHVVIVGGDVATTGMKEDQEFGFKFIKASPALGCRYRTVRGEPTLGVRSKIAVMPGNHDRFQDRRCRSNGTIFESYFDKEWGAPGTRVRTFKIFDRVSNKTLHMIAGDFCLTDDSDSFPTGYPACCGQGTVRDDIIQEMCRRTSYIRGNKPEDGILWLSHFPPSSEFAGFWPSMILHGYGKIIDAALAFDINYILSGHIHENIEFEERGVRILTVGSACSFMEAGGNWVRSLNFEVNNGSVELKHSRDFRWNPNRKKFQ